MIGKLSAWIARNILTAGLAVLLIAAVSVTAIFGISKAGGNSKKVKEMTAALAQTQSELADLKRRYADLESDRNNVIEQTKKLLEEHSKFAELQESYDDLRRTQQSVIAQKEKLLSQNDKLKKERDSLIAYFEKLKAGFEKLQGEHRTLTADKKKVDKLLNDKVESAPQFQALSAEAKNLRTLNTQQTSTIGMLEQKIKTLTDRLKKIMGREDKMKKQIMTSEKNLNQLKKQNTALAGANKGMNQMVAGVPVKFARIAQENRELVKETSEMHYNLGVFYTQNKNFKMAVKEFERALAIDPDNAKSHYNLGYLYAEEFDKHEQAIMHFQRFLEINPAAKEAEAIRTYLLMRQTFGDKAAVTSRNTFKG